MQIPVQANSRGNQGQPVQGQAGGGHGLLAEGERVPGEEHAGCAAMVGDAGKTRHQTAWNSEIQRNQEREKGGAESVAFEAKDLKIKLQQGQQTSLGELNLVHLLIERYYTQESEKVQHQSRVKEFQESERSAIYHHEIHKKIVKKTSILKLCLTMQS